MSSVLFSQNGASWLPVGHLDKLKPRGNELNEFGKAFQAAGRVSSNTVTRLTHFQEVPLSYVFEIIFLV